MGIAQDYLRGSTLGAEPAAKFPSAVATRNVPDELRSDGSQILTFDSQAIEAREALPQSWWERYSFALVRRGYLIRERSDGAGRATAIDAVGPGCWFPLDSGARHEHGPALSAHALSRTLLCLCDEAAVSDALRTGGASALKVHELDRQALARMERLADARGRASALAKVGALLCTLADTLRPNGDGGNRVPADFLQRDLAGLLSIRHESVCRVLRGMARSGLIERDSEGIFIRDRAELERL